MNSCIENNVKIFISKYWHYKKDKLKIETTLDDIGMFGDDKYDFIVDFTKEFNLSLENFPFDKYIDDEVSDVLGLRKLLYGKKLRKICPITISMLIEWIEKGYWGE